MLAHWNRPAYDSQINRRVPRGGAQDMSELIAGIRDRPNRIGRTAWRWVIIYLSAGAVLLEVLDVFSERLGLPNRYFIVMALALLLVLPGVAGAGALRAMAEEEGTPGRRPPSANRTSSARASAIGASTSTRRSREEMSELHYRLARFHEERGDSDRAAHHYEKSLELGGTKGAEREGP